MKTQQLKPRLLRLLWKKWVLEDFAGKKCPESNTIYIYIHTHTLLLFIHFVYFDIYYIKDPKKWSPKTYLLGNLKKTLLSSPEFVTTSFPLRQVETQKVKLHVCSAMSGELLAHIRCLVEFGRAWWNWPAEMMEVLKNTFFLGLQRFQTTIGEMSDEGKGLFFLTFFEGRVFLIGNGPWTCEERDSPEPNPSECHSIMPLCHYVIDMFKRRCRLALLVHILSSRCSRIHFKVCWCGWCQVRLTPCKLWAKQLILEIVSEKNRELKQTLGPQTHEKMKVWVQPNMGYNHS